MNERPLDQNQMERYLDGLLGPAEAAEFERRLRTDKALAEQVRLQREIDASLNRLFQYDPSLAEPQAPDPLPMVRPTRPVAPWRKWGAVAAAAALVGACVYVYWPKGPTFPVLAPEAVYRRFDESGWNPEFKCNNDAEFVHAVDSQFKRKILIPAATVGVVLDGWGYGNSYNGSPISLSTMTLLAHANDKPVLVFMDLLENDRKIKIDRSCKLHLFRREVGGMVLYEVTPWKEPIVINAAVEVR